MSIFDRYLTVWVGLAMIAGVLIGQVAPWLVQAIAATVVASVNLVVAVLIWAMVYPLHPPTAHPDALWIAARAQLLASCSRRDGAHWR